MEFKVGDWLVDESMLGELKKLRVYQFVCLGGIGLVGTSLLRVRPLGGEDDISLMANFCRKATDAEIAEAVAVRIKGKIPGNELDEIANNLGAVRAYSETDEALRLRLTTALVGIGAVSDI